MRTTFLVRIPLEYRAKVLQENLNLGLDSALETMGHILSSYFGGNQPHKPENAVTKSETASVAAVTTPVTEVVTAQKPPAVTTPVTEGSTVTSAGLTPDTPKTLNGGRIYVIA